MASAVVSSVVSGRSKTEAELRHDLEELERQQQQAWPYSLAVPIFFPGVLVRGILDFRDIKEPRSSAM